MKEPPPPPPSHDAGGTYAQADISLAAERSKIRTTQNYRSTAAEGDQTAHEVDETITAPGGQLDSGTS